MSNNLIHTIILVGAFLILFLSAEILYHRFKVRAEITRKYVHLSTGLLSMLFPVLFENKWYVFFLCGSFFIILIISLVQEFLPSINAIKRKSWGSILYPIIVFGCFVQYEHYGQLMMYYIPILILAISDPIAALVGKSRPKGKYTTFGKTKTLSGSTGFFVSSLIICLCLLIGFESIPLGEILVMSISVAMVTTIAEALTHEGYDNLTIPASALVVLIFFYHYYHLI